MSFYGGEVKLWREVMAGRCAGKVCKERGRKAVQCEVQRKASGRQQAWAHAQASKRRSVRRAGQRQAVGRVV